MDPSVSAQSYIPWHTDQKNICTLCLTSCLIIVKQEARSKFSVESEPENSVIIDPSDGYLSPEGSAILHFRRSSPSASLGRINCKVCLIFCVVHFDSLQRNNCSLNYCKITSNLCSTLFLHNSASLKFLNAGIALKGNLMTNIPF